MTRRWAFFDHAAVAPLTGRAQQALAEWAADMAENGDVHEPQLGPPRRGSPPPGRTAAPRRSARRRLRQEHQRGHRHRGGGLSLAAGRQRRHGGRGVPRQHLPVDEPGGPRRRAAHGGQPGPPAVDRRPARRDGRPHAPGQSQLRRVRQRFSQRPRRRRRALPRARRRTSWSMPFRASASCRSTSGHADRFPGRRRAQVAAGARRRGPLLRPPRTARPAAPGRRRLEQRGRQSRLFAHSTSGSSRTPAAARAAPSTSAGITALGASLELLLQLGVPAIATRILDLTDYLCDQAAGLWSGSLQQPAARGQIGHRLAARAGRDPGPLVRQCRAEGVVINQRAGRLRVSPHCYNTPAEIDRLLELLRAARGP